MTAPASRWLIGATAAAAFLILLPLGLDRAFPVPIGRLAQPGRVFLDRNGALLAAAPAPGGVWRLPVRLEDVDPAYLARLIATEDRRFWWHPGVDPVALARAFAQDIRAGHIVSGGSTLTMQLARLIEPRPRTLRSKLIEVFRALQLEAHYSKRDILTGWMTLAPYGGNLEGVTAASLAWLGKLPASLTGEDIALLVALPRRPEALRPDRHPEAARRLRDRLLGEAGGGLPAQRTAMPRHATTALPWGEAASAPGRATLDLPLQAALEAIAAERARVLPPHGALLLMIADLRSHELRAIAASSPDGAGASLDLSRAIRSPGSALKPFIYAMAFEAGLAGPGTLLDDIPRRFGRYAPEDFDRSFAGRVTMAEALRRSLNVPAVALLDGIGPESFLRRLRAAGVTLHLPKNSTGRPATLPLALGGAGITPRDLAALYAAIATDGVVRSLRLTGPRVEAHPLIAQDSAGTIADILVQPFPKGGPVGVAWKTGTSWGGRDAWAVGFDRDHLALAWVGRPDGAPIPGATGLSLAVPLLARALALLPEAPRAITAEPAPEPRRLVQTVRADALQLLFPPAEAVVSGDGPLTLRAMGGRRPLSFLIDGGPVPHDPARREATWLPPGSGWYRVTVLDADGNAAQSVIRVK